MVGVPLQMFLEALGASSVQMGALGTVMVLSAVAQIPGAFICERLNTRKPFWGITALIHRLLWFVVPALPFLLPHSPQAIIWTVLAVAGLSQFLANASAASWFSWMADFVPNRTKGRFWGTRQSYTCGVLLLASWLSGYLLDAWPGAGTPNGSWTGFVIVFVFSWDGFLKVSHHRDVVARYHCPVVENYRAHKQ